MAFSKKYSTYLSYLLIPMSLVFFIFMGEVLAWVFSVNHVYDSDKPSPNRILNLDCEYFDESFLNKECRDPENYEVPWVASLGGSSTRGAPYLSANIKTYTDYLNEHLSLSLGIDIEVGNWGSFCKDSSYIKACALRLLKKKPTALIIYAGHNDVINKGMANSYFQTLVFSKQWIVDSVVWLEKNSRIYSVLNFLISPFVSKRFDEYSMDEFQKRKIFIQESLVRNYNVVIEAAKEVGADVFLATQVSNIAEWRPWLRGLEGNPQMQYYLKARSLQKDGKLLLARDFYTKARDFDPAFKRSFSSLNQSIRDLAAKYEHVHLLDIENELYKSKEPLGCNYFGDKDFPYCDQLHPNTVLHPMMGEIMLPTLVEILRPKLQAK